MTITKIIETVFVKEFNSTAIILQDDIILQCHTQRFMNYADHIQHCIDYKPGYIQTANFVKRNKSKNISPNNPMRVYDEAFMALYKYAKETLSLNLKEPKYKYNF